MNLNFFCKNAYCEGYLLFVMKIIYVTERSRSCLWGCYKRTTCPYIKYRIPRIVLTIVFPKWINILDLEWMLPFQNMFEISYSLLFQIWSIGKTGDIYSIKNNLKNSKIIVQVLANVWNERARSYSEEEAKSLNLSRTLKDFSGGFKLLNKFLIFNGSKNFGQNYFSIVSYPR